MAGKFSVSLQEFADLTLDNMRNVAQDSIQDVVEDAQLPVAKGGRMPVDTGFLRNTVASGLNGSFGPADSTSISLTIEGMDLGDTVNFRWTADYAYLQEMGTSTRPGRHFVGVAAEKWSAFVAANAEKYRV